MSHSKDDQNGAQILENTSKDLVEQVGEKGHIATLQVNNVYFSKNNNVATTLVANVGIQCELEIDAVTQKFYITDSVQRRRLVRKLYATLIIQNIIVIPVIEVFLICFKKPLPEIYYNGTYFGVLVIYSLLNIIRNKRRRSPMNYIILVLTTLLHAGTKGLLANSKNSQWALLYPIILITQLFVLIVYTRLINFKFTNIRGIFLISLVFGIYMIATVFLTSFSAFGIWAFEFLEACYIVYDTQLMMSGHHGYNLEPDEHIFAVANIYADIPRFIWSLIKLFILNHFIELYHLFRDCCPAEVC